MEEVEKLCPNCQQEVETDAAFCGNCGQRLASAASVAPVQSSSTISTVYNNGVPVNGNTVNPSNLATASPAGAQMPAYAIPMTHHKQHWVAMALVFAIIGIGCSILVPILGVAFGIVGIVLVTTSHKTGAKTLRTIALIASILSLLVGIGFWVNNIAHDKNLRSSGAHQASTANGVATINVTTPCYSIKFTNELNVNNSSGSCAMNAYNGASLDTSTNVYKVLASTVSSLNTSNFSTAAKKAIESDVSKNLPGFSVSNEASDLFNGSPAYYVQAVDSNANVAVIEEAVYHQVVNSTNSNFFVIVHAVNGQSANLHDLESNWTWND